MIANLIALPFVVLSLVFLYLAWEVDPDYAIWILPFVLTSAGLYVFSPQINWWWYSRRPKDLSPGLRAMLERSGGLYSRLTAADKLKFRQRVGLFTMGTDWEPMAWPDEEIPPDVQTAISVQAVTLGFRKEKLLFEQFEKVIVYPAPFSTPEYPFDHASELFAADGCLLFSARQVMEAFMRPATLYNVALHEYARVFVLTYPNEPWPALSDESIWEKLQEASGMPRGHVESVIGLAGVEPLPVAVHHYFVFPEGLKRALPEVFEVFEGVFG
jgi:hypothetical protein